MDRYSVMNHGCGLWRDGSDNFRPEALLLMAYMEATAARCVVCAFWIQSKNVNKRWRPLRLEPIKTSDLYLIKLNTMVST